MFQIKTAKKKTTKESWQRLHNFVIGNQLLGQDVFDVTSQHYHKNYNLDNIIKT